MTSANKNNINQSVKAFKGLDIDDQLGILALIYKEVGSSISPEKIGTTPPEVSGLVRKVEQLSEREQLDALRDLLPAEKTDQDEVILDPNPSKALVELATGGNEVATHEYGSMSAESKLTFWYQLGQKLGKNLISTPTDYSPSSKAKELFNSLKSLEVDDQMSFLSQVV